MARPTSTIVLHDRRALPCNRVGKRDLMGTAEIALRLGVGKSRANQIVRERDFPLPAARLIMGPVWETGDVEKWIARRRPHLAQPPKT